MYPVHPSATVDTAKHTAKQATVSLKKMYVKGLDAIYSSDMWHMPKIPKFKPEDEQ